MPSIRYIALCTPVVTGGCDAHGPACPTPGKRPLVADWANSWTLERPEGNAGVLTGPETGLLVIDIDTPESDAQYEAWGLPHTFTVLSGRGGGASHRYFRWPAGLERVPNRLDGVEIKGAGRQVVAWDSLHKSGMPYTKLGGQFAELPEAFVQRLRTATPQHSLSEVLDATPEASAALDRLLAVLPDAEVMRDGNWQATCPAHADHDPSLVLTASDNRVLVHCRAGCPAGDVMGALGLSLSDLWAREPLPQKPAPEELLKRRLGAASDSLGTRFRLTELMGAELGSVRWAVPGMVPDGLTLLAGPPKLGKSWLVLDLAIQVAAGGRFLDSDVEQGDALYLALEDNPRRLQGRARMLLAGAAAPERLELWTRAGKLSNGLIPDIEAWLDEQADPRLVIIDTLGRVQDNGTLDSKDGGYADAVEALAGLQDVAAARGVAVVVITHTKKGGWSATGDPLEAVLGSQGYAGTADSILVLKRERGEELGQLFVTGREIEDETTLKIRFDDEACRWVMGHEMTLEQEILAAVAAKPFQLTGTGVVRAVGARKAEVLAVLAALEATGKLIQAKPEGGGWERWGPPV